MEGFWAIDCLSLGELNLLDLMRSCLEKKLWCRGAGEGASSGGEATGMALQMKMGCFIFTDMILYVL